MANNENLIPFTSEQSHEKAVENGRKGGIASGISKRKNKTFKELASLALGGKVTNAKLLRKLAEMDIDTSEVTEKMLVVLGMVNAAKNGNVKAFEKLQELTGELYDNSDTMNKLDTMLAEIDKVMQE